MTEAATLQPRGRRGTLWSQDDAALAADLWQRYFADYYGDDIGPDGARMKTLTRISVTVGRSYFSCEQRLQRYGPSFGANRRHHAGAPVQQLADRDARKEAEMRQPPASRLLGDPLPGYSALDKRNRA